MDCQHRHQGPHQHRSACPSVGRRQSALQPLASFPWREVWSPRGGPRPPPVQNKQSPQRRMHRPNPHTTGLRAQPRQGRALAVQTGPSRRSLTFHWRGWWPNGPSLHSLAHSEGNRPEVRNRATGREHVHDHRFQPRRPLLCPYPAVASGDE